MRKVNNGRKLSEKLKKVRQQQAPWDRQQRWDLKIGRKALAYNEYLWDYGTKLLKLKLSTNPCEKNYKSLEKFDKKQQTHKMEKKTFSK